VSATTVELNQTEQASGSATVLSELLPALRRLDTLLERAVNGLQAQIGISAATSFQGLFISREQVDRLLAQEPGQSPFRIVDPLPTDNSDTAASPSPLDWLIQSFGLSSFDADIILLALAPEIDLRYEKIYSYLQDDVTRKRPTVDLALNLLCSSADDKLSRRTHFSPGAPLIRHRLVQIVRDPAQSESSSLAHPFRLDDQIRKLLLGQGGLDDRLSPFCRLINPAVAWNEVTLSVDVKHGLQRIVEDSASGHKPLRLYFQGPAEAEKEEAAEGLAGLLSASLLRVRLDRIPETMAPDLLWSLVTREAQLHHAVLFLSNLDDLRSAEAAMRRRDLLEGVAAHGGLTIFAGRVAREPRSIAPFGIIAVDFQVPDFGERYERWQSEVANTGSTIGERDLEMLAGRFRLTPLQISRAVVTAQLADEWSRAQSGTAGDSTFVPALSLEELCAAARSQCGSELANLAPKLNIHYGWDDLILPPDAKMQLREICSQAESRSLVYGKWGFDRKLSFGKGLNVLFTGPPGTGKTMGAEVIARELALDLYRIDLSQVVSKYIGETEKNLDRIFTAAEDSNAILFFDEADALFGKRSEVRDSHDRYANIEISYLLQKMEEYQGVSVLATNLRQNIDEAFVRRLQAIVEFPFPDEEYRRRIWQSVFPHETPVGADVRFDLLASEVRLAGGNIKNIALGASFYAAADGGVVHLSHLLHAASREHQKMARSWIPGELLKAAASTGASNGTQSVGSYAGPSA
jgi:ATPase family associated with various cellular activities (AAA)